MSIEKHSHPAQNSVCQNFQKKSENSSEGSLLIVGMQGHDCQICMIVRT